MFGIKKKKEAENLDFKDLSVGDLVYVKAGPKVLFVVERLYYSDYYEMCMARASRCTKNRKIKTEVLSVNALSKANQNIGS